MITFISFQGILQTIDIGKYIEMPLYVKYIIMALIVIFSLVTSVVLWGLTAIMQDWFFDIDHVILRLQKIEFEEPNPYSRAIFKKKLNCIKALLPVVFLLLFLSTIFELLTKNVSD